MRPSQDAVCPAHCQNSMSAAHLHARETHHPCCNFPRAASPPQNARILAEEVAAYNLAGICEAQIPYAPRLHDGVARRLHRRHDQSCSRSLVALEPK